MTARAFDPAVCPLCERANACGMAKGAPTCWCAALTISPVVLDRLPEAAKGVACVCRNCATSTTSDPSAI